MSHPVAWSVSYKGDTLATFSTQEKAAEYRDEQVQKGACYHDLMLFGRVLDRAYDYNYSGDRDYEDEP